MQDIDAEGLFRGSLLKICAENLCQEPMLESHYRPRGTGLEAIPGRFSAGSMPLPPESGPNVLVTTLIGR